MVHLFKQYTPEKYDDALFDGRIIIKHSKRARRLALRLDNKNRVFNLIVPAGVSIRKARAFAQKHQAWIEERLSALPATVKFSDGITIPLFGQDMTFDIHHSDQIKNTKINLRGAYLNIRTNQQDPTSRIVRFLKTEAKNRMGAIADEKAAYIEKTVKTIRIGDMKSRWGSCSHDGRISLSWRLIFAPYEAMDYVIAHEVAHLRHLDHSKKFWALCRDLSDNFVEGSYWMKNHGHTLMRYG